MKPWPKIDPNDPRWQPGYYDDKQPPRQVRKNRRAVKQQQRQGRAKNNYLASVVRAAKRDVT